jgi:hypothetical protein
VPLTQSQRRDTHSLDQTQLAPAGAQAVPAMLKGQVPASTVMEGPSSALASAVNPGPPSPPAPGPGPTTLPPAPAIAGAPAPPNEGAPPPPEPPDDASPLW